MRNHLMGFTLLLASALLAFSAPAQGDPLPSWNDGDAKTAIIEFVERVTDEGSPDFVPVYERIATFDNDGTLWSEQPLYFQVIFALDQVKAKAADHPEWATTEPFKSAIAGDMEGLMKTGMAGLAKVMGASHTDVTADEFAASVNNWLDTARHPTTGKRYDEMVFQPMLELLEYLRESGFKTFIVSGGGIDFMRVFAERVYGIPPEQVVGSSIDARFEMRDGVPTIIKEGKGLFVDDKAGKPAGIYRHIGRRPLFAGGNSDGDLQMVQYTTMPRGPEDTTPRFGLFVHHTDADREFAYDTPSHIGEFKEAAKLAPENGWLVVDMKNDWKLVYPD
ncbi:haloacid dehalogenase-like hydrolase [Marinihelvus fidelis]|uniref:Haloacid dehalogenase-like hydrolase n=1 Tax=Marinihelvus fidelis TaxID=2613842 RepID=A0A5N0THQ8_9GAMM|nr:HAD family hydrolase [Marinihelvus fidelis]KAA9134018.1 haloacid dehalogenase-like hydrolase [Marinihelvus fidelis]